jgi:hypothetical protein
MIKEKRKGDVMKRHDNPHDVGIAMNPKGEELREIGRRYWNRGPDDTEIPLGSVLSFIIDDESECERRLHMFVCHRMGVGGWEYAHAHLLMGMQQLWDQNRMAGEPGRIVAMVRMGAGDIGKRDGADPELLERYMDVSELPVIIYTRGDSLIPLSVGLHRFGPLQARSLWTPDHGLSLAS